MSKIDGGATLWARQTIDSDIFYNKPDKWFKIWFYLINEVNHKDNRQFKRGSCFMRYEWIMEKTKANKNEIDHCIRWLKSATMIATRKATRGFTLNILNYNGYQSLENYKSDTKSDSKSEMKAKQKRNESDTINKNDNNDKNEIMKKEILSSKLDLEAPILYLNEKAKRKFDSKLSANRDLVKARYNEGRSLGDFKQVINKKVSDWLSDEKMMKYLRPSTLFNRVNFENYLNEPTKTINTDDESQPKWEKKEIIKLTPEQVARDKVRLKELANQVKRIGNMPGTAKGGIK